MLDKGTHLPAPPWLLLCLHVLFLLVSVTCRRGTRWPEAKLVVDQSQGFSDFYKALYYVFFCLKAYKNCYSKPKRLKLYICTI